MPSWKKIITSGSDANLSSLVVTGGITGSLQGTASYALSALNASTASYFSGSITTAETASYVLPLRQAVLLTGSLNVSGSTTQIGNNTLAGNTTLSGSIIMSGSTTSPVTPTIKVFGDMETNGVIKFTPVDKSIDTTISASYIYVSGSTNDLYFSQNGSGYTNFTRLRWIEGNLYTGLLSGGVITSTPGSTTFSISSGSGIIVSLNAFTSSADPFPTIQYITWPTTTQPITNSGSAKITYVGISNVGTVVQQTVPWGSTNINQWDQQIELGTVLHLSGSVSTGVYNSPQVGYGEAQRTDDFVRSFGPLKISGHVLQPSGSTLSLIKSAGFAYNNGANYINNPNHPSTVSDPAITVSKIYKYYISGSTPVIDTGVAAAGYTVIDPSKYVRTSDGTLQNIPGGQYSIQRVFWFPNSPTNAFIVYYGNDYYNSAANAQLALQTEVFTEAPNTAQNAIFLGSIIIAASETNLQNATIVPAGLFRQVGGIGSTGTTPVTTALSSLSDVAITSVTAGDLLTYGGGQWNNSKTLNGTYTINGGLTVTGSLIATASRATSASRAESAVTASYVLNAVSASYSETASYVNPLRQTVLVTGSLNISSGSLNITSGSQTFSTTFIPPGSGNIINLNSNGNLGLNAGAAAGIAFVVNNISQAMYITSASQVLIGNPRVSPLESGSATLHVTNVGTSNTFLVEDSTNPDSSPFVIDASGNVAIGTITPNAKLDVVGNTIITGSLNVTAGITGSLFGTASWAQNAVTASFITTAQTASYVLNAVTASYSETASYVNPLRQTVLVTGSLIISASGTTNDLQVGTNKLFVSASGNVGIGTAAPNARLHVSGGGAETIRIETSASIGSGPYMTFYGNNTMRGYVGYGASTTNQLLLMNQASGANDSLNLGTNSLIRLTVSSSGEVGIGTSYTSPSSLLSLLAPVNSFAFDITNAAETPFKYRIINSGSAVAPGLSFKSGLYYDNLENATVNFWRGSSTTGGFLTFNTNNGTERMRIDSAGNLLVGTTTPALGTSGRGLIEVNGSLSATFVAKAGDTARGYFGAIATATELAAVGASQPLLLTTNGAERMRIDSSGNVGIGITAPTAKLHVTNTGTNNSFLAEDSTNPDTTPFVIDAAGNTGIGTTTPNAKLDVVGNTIITGSLNVTAGITGSLFGTASWAQNAATSSYVLNSVSSSFASTASFLNTLNQDLTFNGNLTLNGTASISYLNVTFESASVIYSSGSNQLGDATNDTQTLIGTTVLSGSLQLTGSANLPSITGSLLGTASFANTSQTASYVLNSISSSYAVNADTASVATLALSVGTLNQVLIVSGSSTAGTSLVRITQTGAGNAFLVEDEANVDSTPFVIDTTGNVGIGTLTPTAKLDVVGNANISGSLSVTGVVNANLTGSVFGTASWAQNAVTASYIVTAQTASYVLNAVSSSFASTSQNANTASFVTTAQTASYVLNAVSASFATSASRSVSSSFATTSQTASYVLNAVTASFVTLSQTASFVTTAQTASYVLNAVSSSFTSTSSFVNTLNQNVLITGSLTIGSGSLGPSENTLTLGPRDNVQEGGQLGFAAAGGTYTSASFIDLYQNRLRILRGTNAGSDAEVAAWNMHTKQMQLPAYNSAAAFPGTSVANLAVDSSGNIITIATGTVTSASFASTASFVNTLNQNVIITGSVAVTQNITASAFATTDALITSTATTINSGITTIYNIPTASYDGAWFDYTIRSGSNARAGSIMGVWSGTAVNYTETTTTDFGNTSGFALGMSIVGANMILSSSATTSGWSFNAIVRSI